MNFHLTYTSKNLHISVIDDDDLVIAKSKNVNKCEIKSNDIFVSHFVLSLKKHTILDSKT